MVSKGIQKGSKLYFLCLVLTKQRQFLIIQSAMGFFITSVIHSHSYIMHACSVFTIPVILCNFQTAFRNFCRQENCYRCFDVYLPVPDCCATRWERSAEWGWRDNKVQRPQYRHWHSDYRRHIWDKVVLVWILDQVVQSGHKAEIFLPTVCYFSQPPDGNVLPDNPHARTWYQTGVRVWRQAPKAQVSRG